MAVLNFANREITARIVYFGASGAGCNTNVRRLYDMVASRERSRLHRFGPATSQEISWYFDYAPVEPLNAAGFSLRVRVYSLPGGIELAAHRDEVLDQVDGVVFVADPRRDAAQANLDRLIELERQLAVQGLELAALAVVIQVNRADDTDARELSEVVSDLNPYGFPVVSAIASRGEGVVEAHRAVTDALQARIRDALQGNDAAITLSAWYHATSEADDDSVVRRHLEAIREKTTSPAALLEATEDTGALSDTGATVEIPFSPREMVFARPIEVLGADMVGERIAVHLLMDPIAGGELQRMSVLLVPDGGRDGSVPSSPNAVKVPTSDARIRSMSSKPPEPGPGAFLPDVVDLPLEDSEEVDREEITLVEPPDDRPADLPGWLYGSFGVGAGVVIGMLLGYLVDLA